MRLREDNMLDRSATGAVAVAVAVAVALMVTVGGVQAFDDAKYPNWKGQWTRVMVPGVRGQPGFDPTKPWGPGQQAPLTAEYQKVLEDSMADQAKGGLGNYPTARCLPGGMPRMMTFGEHEYVITPETTYILIGGADHFRRIFTDGRDWPTDVEPTYAGYSIGRWVDEDGDGRYDVLEIETRGFKGPRSYEATGIPLHEDSESVIRERIYIDRADADTLHDEITVIDHALTRPWTVDKRYKRDHNPIWFQNNCSEDNRHVFIGNEHYVISGDDFLMPAKKDQAPPDLRYFKQMRK